MMTVVDHVSPWLTPNSTLATTIQAQEGAHPSRNGMGKARIHPVTSTGFGPTRSEMVPAKKLVTAFTAPKATIYASAAV
jgi:hypothetical protein